MKKDEKYDGNFVDLVKHSVLTVWVKYSTTEMTAATVIIIVED